MARNLDANLAGMRPSRRVAAKPPSRLGVVLRYALRHPFGTVVTASFAALSVAILFNALSQQTRAHPAPLFAAARPAQIEATPAVAVPRAPAPPPQRPAVEPAARAPVQQETSIPAIPAPPVAAVPVPERRPRDAIGDMIRNTVPESGPATSIAPVTGPVANAQRALSKLGYGPLKADGVLGSGTRQAIENFEKDRHLPVTGELSPRTVREMTAASGIAID